MKRQSLIFKLISFVSMFILAAGIFLGIVLALTYAHYEDRRLTETLSKELEIVSYAASAGLEFNDIKTVEEAVLQLRNVREFVRVRVMTPDGHILVAKDFNRDGKNAGSGYFTVSAPVFNAVSARVGQIEATATSRYLRANISHTLWIVLTAAVPIAFLAIFFLSFYFRKFLMPLGRLREAIDKVSEEGFIGRVDVVSNDEVGELAVSFNAMSANLRDTTVSRDELVREMGERMKAQKSLEAANTQLKQNQENLQNMLEESRRMQEQLKSARDRLVQAEKLAAIGQLAAGVAHEINNPASFVASNLEVLQTYVAGYLRMLRLARVMKGAVERKAWGEAAAVVVAIGQLETELNMNYIISDSEHIVQQSRDGIGRIEKIVADLKIFAHEGTRWFEELVKIENVIEMALSIAHNELRYRIDLRKEYGDTPQVRCSVQKMGQVFLNLLINAAQAIQDKGVIAIRTYVDAGHVCVDISDTGCGITEENLKKVFDPFFTTKPVGKGTGLGLSISYELVKKQGGEIHVKSTDGKGATFTVRLPISRDEGQHKAS